MTISSVLEAIGFLMLTAPLYFLFRAALARSGAMKSQLVGVIVVAPLFFAISGVLNGIATNEAADAFNKGEAKSTLSAGKGAPKNARRRTRQGREGVRRKVRRRGEPAQRLRNDRTGRKRSRKRAERSVAARCRRPGSGWRGGSASPSRSVYSCLWAMRVGLLTRFWGSLGMALGVAALLLLVQFR